VGLYRLEITGALGALLLLIPMAPHDLAWRRHSIWVLMHSEGGGSLTAFERALCSKCEVVNEPHRVILTGEEADHRGRIVS